MVIGQDMIGAFSAAWLMDRGCRVIVCDVAGTINMKHNDVMERLKVMLNGGADIEVESSGVSARGKAAFALLRKKP